MSDNYTKRIQQVLAALNKALNQNNEVEAPNLSKLAWTTYDEEKL